MNFSENLKIALWARHLRPTDLANETGISQPVVSQYTSGSRLPMLSGIIKIANCLEVSLDWLLDRKYRNRFKPDGRSFGEHVDEYLEMLNISDEKLMDALYMHPKTLRRIREGGDIRLTTAEDLADFLEVSLDYLTDRGVQEGIPAAYVKMIKPRLS